MTAVKAKIKAPLQGWDFIKKYKLDTVWGEFGDLYLRDKKAMIMKKLNHVTIPHGSLPRVEAVEVVPHLNSCAVAAEFLRFGTSCINALVTSPDTVITLLVVMDPADPLFPKAVFTLSPMLEINH